uniref:Uncharacterized protein n=1 Tax=Leersia perrieri TaxID=77586 RepID=A0A0D9WYT3_9ORYZ
MECAAKGLVAEPCAGEANRRCNGCGAVAYCSRAHQLVHRRFHKQECARLAEQMSRVDTLKNFPFTFSVEPPAPNQTFPSPRCFFLESFKLHQKGLWKSECICGPEVTSVKDLSISTDWSMGSTLCPCTDPENYVSTPLTSWKDYYRWRSLPLHSPVAVLLHWAFDSMVNPDQNILCLHLDNCTKKQSLLIRQNGIKTRAWIVSVDKKEENINYTIDFRDGEVITISNYGHCSAGSCSCKSRIDSKDLSCSAVIFKLRKGLYHERYSDIVKDSNPHLIVAPNAGVAAYPSWMPTIEIIRKVGIPAIFTDFCEEAAHLASSCISSITGQPLRVPIQLTVHAIRQA